MRKKPIKIRIFDKRYIPLTTLVAVIAIILIFLVVGFPLISSVAEFTYKQYTKIKQGELITEGELREGEIERIEPGKIKPLPFPRPWPRPWPGPQPLNLPPVANIVALNASCTVNQFCYFDGSGSYDPDGNISNYSIEYSGPGVGGGSASPGAPGILTQNFTIAGNWTVTLTVTDNQGSSASDSLTIIVYSVKPDYTISDISFYPSSPIEGELVTITTTAHNTGGNANKSYTTAIRIKFMIDSVTNVIDTIDVPSDSSLWNAEGEYTTNTTWIAESGSHIIYAWVDDSPDTAEGESNDGNNVMSKVISVSSVVGQPDLMVSNITWTPESPVESDNITISIIITNIGNVSANASTLRIDLVGTAMYELVSTPQLAPGGDTLIATGWGLVAGNYTIKATADVNGEVDESDENNNIKEEIMIVAEPVECTSPADCTATPYGACTYVYGCVDNTCDYRNDGCWEFTGCQAGDPDFCSYCSYPSTEHNYCTGGKDEDCDGLIDMDDPDCQPSSQPDLSVASADISFKPSSPTEGQTVNISAVIYNDGNASAGSFVVAFTDVTKGYLIGTQTQSSLAAKSGIKKAVSYYNVSSGNHTIRVTVDYYNNITEWSEANNQADEILGVSPAAKYESPLTTLTRTLTDLFRPLLSALGLAR